MSNPASGKDLRRLVAHGSTFNNQEKVNIVRRILLGLDALGVGSVLTMPDAFGICRQAQERITPAIPVQELDLPVEYTAADTTAAATRMQELGVDCIVCLGGDGTIRAVAAADGRLEWEQSYRTDGGRHTDGFYADPAADGDTLYAGTLGRKLVAVATSDGDRRWTRQLDWDQPPTVTVDEETLYAAGGRHLLAYR
jgi:hypothetical protein